MLGLLMILMCWIGAFFLVTYSDFTLFESFVIIILSGILTLLSLIIKNK